MVVYQYNRYMNGNIGHLGGVCYHFIADTPWSLLYKEAPEFLRLHWASCLFHLASWNCNWEGAIFSSYYCWWTFCFSHTSHLSVRASLALCHQPLPRLVTPDYVKARPHFFRGRQLEWIITTDNSSYNLPDLTWWLVVWVALVDVDTKLANAYARALVMCIAYQCNAQILIYTTYHRNGPFPVGVKSEH